MRNGEALTKFSNFSGLSYPGELIQQNWLNLRTHALFIRKSDVDSHMSEKPGHKILIVRLCWSLNSVLWCIYHFCQHHNEKCSRLILWWRIVFIDHSLFLLSKEIPRERYWSCCEELIVICRIRVGITWISPDERLPLKSKTQVEDWVWKTSQQVKTYVPVWAATFFWFVNPTTCDSCWFVFIAPFSIIRSESKTKITIINNLYILLKSFYGCFSDIKI